MENYFFIKKGGKTLKNKGFFLNVPKSVHKHAVVRNRIKRRMRPLLLDHPLLEKVGHVVVSIRKDISSLSVSHLQEMIKKELSKFY
ncbi:MAG: ribonuclease P protein component [Candidatus Pacebacteria bacterium]|nr:ribonuclease P protein component [Candidatus Paceibacterota bacterium]